MTLRELAFDTLRHQEIRKSLYNLDRRRRLQTRGDDVTVEDLNRNLIPSIRKALIDLNKEKDWKDVDAIIWGRLVYTKSGITIFESDRAADVAGETHDALRIIRF